MRRIDARTETGRAELAILRAAIGAEGGMVSEGADVAKAELEVARVLEDVRDHGDEAVCEWTNRFDGSRLTPGDLRVPETEIETAYEAQLPEFIETVTRIRDRIRTFQRQTLVRDPAPVIDGGRVLRLVHRPLARVGVRAPGGKAFYPSSVLMTAVPALAAGVPEVAVAAPPTADGDVHPAILAICRVCGIEEVYRIGGTPSIAAFAYGTETVPPVEKVAGPGNLYVTMAKKMVYGRVDIDSLAGPSEVIVLADASAEASVVAADLLSQAEHDPGSAILVTPDDALADAVGEQVEAQLEALDRAEVTRAALEEYSAVVLVEDLDVGVGVVNDFAPEHLQILTEDPEAILRDVRCAGAVFLGRWTPVAVGDYVAGPSHTLPTGGTARWASGLTANDFVRSMSVIQYDRDALVEDTEDIVQLAGVEGLTAHAESVRKRLESKS